MPAEEATVAAPDVLPDVLSREGDEVAAAFPALDALPVVCIPPELPVACAALLVLLELLVVCKLAASSNPPLPTLDRLEHCELLGAGCGSGVTG